MNKEDIPFKDYDHAAKMRAGFHFTIDLNGHWYCHDPAMGVGPIKNERISKLFAGAGTGKYAGKGLSIENGKYFLKAPPADLYGVDVEDVPFIIADFILDDKLTLVTNFGEVIDPTEFLHKEGVFPDIPYVEIRKGLLARLGRNVFYQLAEKAINRDGMIGIESQGKFLPLGPM